MLFVMGDRNQLIAQFPKNAAWAEIGVYRGDFSDKILNLCAPSEFHLIDMWKFDIKEQNPFDDTAENFAGFSGKIHWEHFGDNPNETQERNYQYVKARFAQNPVVRVIRSDSINGIRNLTDKHFDVLYIDANHQYEYVLRDMMEARAKLKPGGVLLMNDYYEGPGGAEQNLGVMGAVTTFVKRYGFHYVAMTYGAYCDLALTEDPASPFVAEILQNLKDSDLQFIGIPDALVPNVRYKVYQKKNGQQRYVALC